MYYYPPVSYLVMLVLALHLFVSSSMCYGRALTNQTRFHLAQVPLASRICAIDGPSQTVLARSSLECSELCQNRVGCNNFNYVASNNTCRIFTFTPKCYDMIASCSHYQKSSNQPFLGFPLENCSLPYTYNTNLYMGCALNITGVPCNFGCLTSNRVAITCQRETGNFTATYVNKAVSIRKGINPMLLQSVNNWIVIQQRLDGSVNFTLNWAAYRTVFGLTVGNFWLGLENMHQLTSQTPYRLRVELQSSEQGKWASAEYASFQISSETLGYAIIVSGYIGDAGDAIQNKLNFSGDCYQNGMKFTTIDVDNDLAASNCAVLKGGGGWWFNSCSYCNLNNPIDNERFYWLSLIDEGVASTGRLQACRMMIKMT